MNALEYLAELRLPDGRRWVSLAADFQLRDAKAALSDDGPPYAFWTRPRGGSKTLDGGGCVLCAMLAAPGPINAFAAAADADQAALALESIRDFALATPAIAERLEVQSRRVVVKDTGARLTVLAADAASAFGLRPDLLFVDELAQWPATGSAQRFWEAISSALVKSPTARMIVATTAGDPAHPSARVLEAAKASELWRVSEVPGPVPWANPARVEEQRRRLPRPVFEQLILNRWVAGVGAFLDPAVLNACFTLDGPSTAASSTVRYYAALDIGVVNDRTVFALGHREGPATALDRLQVWEGSKASPVRFEEVERFILAAHEQFGFELRLDPWQGLDLAQRLRRAGIPTTEFTFSAGSKQRLASVLLGAINTSTLHLYPAEGLREELLGLRVKQTRAGWSFDHSASGHDDRAVAISLMLLAALEAGPDIAIAAAEILDAEGSLYEHQWALRDAGGSGGLAASPTQGLLDAKW